jgi:hypothetical protein
VADAGDILWALTAPEMMLRLLPSSVELRQVRGVPAKAMVDALLAPPGR